MMTGARLDSHDLDRLHQEMLNISKFSFVIQVSPLAWEGLGLHNRLLIISMFLTHSILLEH